MPSSFFSFTVKSHTVFEVLEKKGKRRLGKLTTMHGDIYTPAFGPDATRGLIRNIAPHELWDLGGNNTLEESKGAIQKALAGEIIDNKQRRESDETQFILTNTYHMRSFPGDEFIKQLGGIHKFMNCPFPILTDSGGFQVFSLIHGAKSLKGKVTDDGAFFNNPVNGNRLELTPEKAIDIQFNLGSDIMVVLDDCRHYKDDKELKQSVYRTIEWAKRCREHFDKKLKETCQQSSTFEGRIQQSLKEIPDKSFGFSGMTEEIGEATKLDRPLLFCVVQGGIDYDLRKFCTEELVKIGFDGYGFGGWAIDENIQSLYDMMGFVAERLPEDKPRYAMGIGTPKDMLQCIDYGYDLFDCVIPSRNARHGIAYTTEGVVKILNSTYKTDTSPLDLNLQSIASDYQKYYLHHLFKVKDSLGGELLTLHNLKYFNYVMRLPFIEE